MMEHILITGASGGLGKTVTARFLEAGYRVTGFSSKNSRAGWKQHERLRIVQADLKNEEETASAVQYAAQAGSGIDAGILLAGGFAMGLLQETSMKDLEKMYQLNFITAYNTARPLMKQMENQGSGGQIIFIGARPVLEPESATRLAAYTLSKSMLFNLAELINAGSREKGITATVIVPGIIDTPANREAMPEADFNRWVTPEHLADHMLHLLTPAGRTLRKTVLRVYGNS